MLFGAGQRILSVYLFDIYLRNVLTRFSMKVLASEISSFEVSGKWACDRAGAKLAEKRYFRQPILSSNRKVFVEWELGREN